MEKKGSEIRCAIQELSTMIVLLNKVKNKPLVDVVDNEEDEKDHKSTTIITPPPPSSSSNTQIPIKPFLSICSFLLQVLG